MRVGALQSFKDGILCYYGEGSLLNDKIPDAPPFNTVNISNPCIKLDSGKYVWGFECWWGELEKFKSEYADKATEIIMVEPDNIQPVNVKKEE